MANQSILAAFERFWQHTIAKLGNKADIDHTHDVVTSAIQDGNGNVITSTYETKNDASSKLTEAKSYADSAATTVKNDLLNGAGEAYDTLKELGDLIDDNVDAIDALETVATGKADKADVAALSQLVGDTAVATQISTAIDSHTHDYNDLESKPAIPASVIQVGNEFAIGASEESISNVTTWVKQTSTTNQRERACLYGGGYYIICGTSGEMTYSTDGSTWTEITPFTTDVITGICYGKGIFLAVDSGGKLWKATSPMDAWRDSGITLDVIIESICYANNRFIAACDGGFVVLSDDGENWKTVQTCTTNNLYGICAGDGMFIAVGATGTIITSIDGNTWNDRTNPAVTGDLRCVGYGNGMFVAGGAGGVIESSPDAVTWTVGTSNTTLTINYIRAIVYAYGKFYAVMYTSNGTGEIWVSEDAITWTVQYSTAGRLWCAASNDKMVFTSGDSGAIYTLNFGVEWLNEKPDHEDDEYLWQRNVVILSDGGTIISEAYCASDDSVTADSIQTALGYMPVKPEDLESIDVALTSPKITEALGYTPADQSNVSTLQGLVGDTPVATQINTAVAPISTDITNLQSQLDSLVASAVHVHSGTEAAMIDSLGEDGDIYLVTE